MKVLINLGVIWTEHSICLCIVNSLSVTISRTAKYI